MGEDFVLFRNGERARRIDKAPARALPIYAQLIAGSATGAYADAARVASALCHIDLGKRAEGVAALQQFLRAFPDSLHRGEALLILAQQQVELTADIRGALTLIAQADDWIRSARQRRVIIDDLPMKPAAKPLAKAPNAEKTKDFFGNYDRADIAPGMLLNQATCSWYLDDLEQRVATQRGVAALVMGRKDEALRQFQRLATLDPECALSSHDPNDRTRLIWGATHGYLFAYPQELQAFNDHQRLIILLADVAYCTEDFAKARALAERLLADEFGKLTAVARDYPRYLKASSTLQLDGRTVAIDQLLTLVDTAQSAFTRDRAAYTVGKLACNIAPGPRRDAAFAHLHALIRSGEPSEWKWQSFIVWAMHCRQIGDWDQAQRTLAAMPKQAAEFHELAQWLSNDYRTEQQRLLARSATAPVSATRAQSRPRSATASIASPSSTSATAPARR